MAINANELIDRLDPADRLEVEQQAAQLIAEEMTLQELRKARRKTQEQVASRLGITQEGVSRIEKRSDLLLSTLRRTVEAMGGVFRWSRSFPTGIRSS